MSNHVPRSRNVMLFNFPEFHDKYVEVRRKHDDELVPILLGAFIPRGSNNSFKTAGAGRRIPKLRPLKVILLNESDVIM